MPRRHTGSQRALHPEKAGGRSRAEAERRLAMRFVTYINSAEQKIEMEMWALKDYGSHLPPSQSYRNYLSFLSGAQAAVLALQSVLRPRQPRLFCTPAFGRSEAPGPEFSPPGELR